ncbi:MAG: hypothetical protein HQ594_03770 [Candidatus Omnitrophica bacterium]|nr:hypothetical protein [Candidatus Omnitrophota bacterium]
MRIGWRTIVALKRFLCERQNALVRKKAGLKGVSFEIKRGRFGNLLKQINEDMCRNNPISPDWFESILSILAKDKFIEPMEDNRHRFMVSEEAYRFVGIEMAKPKESSKIKKEKQRDPGLKEDLKEKKIKGNPPQPLIWVMSAQERIARPEAIAQFEKGILLYYKRCYQKAVVEFQKVIDDYSNTVIDVTCKAKQYMGFCKDELRKDIPPLDMELSKEDKIKEGGYKDEMCYIKKGTEQ